MRLQLGSALLPGLRLLRGRRRDCQEDLFKRCDREAKAADAELCFAVFQLLQQTWEPAPFGQISSLSFILI